jgi:peptidoglycan/LPS O-acetylase OafA/YrhL
LWFDAKGMTPLTARLFASPLIGLGLGMALVSRSADWREIMIPAMGMVTIGVLATLALVLSREDFSPQSPFAWFVAALPLILLVIGLVLLRSRPRPSPDAHAAAQAMRMRKAA